MNADSDIYSPQLKVSDLRKKKEVKILVDPLVLSKDQIRKIKDVFESEMALGLSKAPVRTSCLQMENTYITELPDGTEEGEFLALDLGGTNFRVIFLSLKPPEPADYVVKYYSVPEVLRLGKGESLFDFLATCIHDFMKSNNLLEKNLPLGFCFSFPVIQKALDVGVLVPWVASYFCPDFVGKDIARMLSDAIVRRGDINVHVAALVNDTTGTLIKGAYLDRKCAIGFVLGTGCNACYLEKIHRLEKWENKPSGFDEVIVDTEMSSFGDNGVLDFIKTEFDKALDEQSRTVNCIIFEKFVAGKFIGELVRLAMLKLISAGLLFNGMLSRELSSSYSFAAKDVSEIEGNLHFVPTCVRVILVITTRMVSSIGFLHVLQENTQTLLRDVEGSGENSLNAILRRLGVQDITDDDAAIVKYICSVVSVRSAVLVSICLACLLDRMDKPNVTIAVDGSLYKNHPKLPKLIVHFLSEISGGRKFQLMLAEDGSGKGAGLVAALATRLRKKTET